MSPRRTVCIAPARIAVLLATLALGGCEIGDKVGTLFSRGVERIGERRSTDEPLVIAVRGPTAVDVDSLGGHVRVLADANVQNAVITVTRRALHGHGRGDEADLALRDMGYTAELGPGAIGPVLRIRTATDNPEPHFLRVDFEIRLPELDGVRIHTRRGNVTVRGMTGALDIETADGDVRLMTPRPMQRPVTIINHAGDIDYRVRGDSTAAFDVEAVRGVVLHVVREGAMSVHRGTTHNRLLGTLNEGENPVVLRAADGDVRIAVVEDPTAIGTFVVD